MRLTHLHKEQTCWMLLPDPRPLVLFPALCVYCRVGRTARYTATGRGLLLLLPLEKDGMLQQLQDAKVPLKQLKHNPQKVTPIGPSLSALLSKNVELKSFAQSGLVAYARSVFLQPNKAVFDAGALPLDEYAESLGLLAAPQLKFLKRVGKKVVQEVVVGTAAAAAAGEAAAADAAAPEEQQRKRRRLSPKSAAANAEATSDGDAPSGVEQDGSQPPPPAAAAAAADSSKKRKQPPAAADSDDDDGDFLTVKQHNVFDVEAPPAAAAATAAADGDDDEGVPEEACNQRDPALAAAEAVAAAAAARPKKRKKQKIKLGAVSGQRVVFDDEGEQVDPLELLASQGLGGGQSGAAAASDDADAADEDADGLHVVAAAAGERFERAAQLMAARDQSDKAALAALRRQAKLDKKLRRKAAAQQVSGMLPGRGGASGCVCLR
jgi:ATP-dependent RNA helicase DDX10/DBP4